jgi:hypothetical protein
MEIRFEFATEEQTGLGIQLFSFMQIIMIGHL